MITDLRPKTWAAFVGQAAMRERLVVYMKASLARSEPLPHILLAAGSGYGKTSLAELIAGQVQDQFFKLTMPIKRSGLHSFFNNFPGGVVLLDEFHRLNASEQEEMLTILEDKYFTTPSGRRVPVNSWFTAIVATTEVDDILDTVLRRIPIRHLNFVDYTDEELGQVIAGMATKLDVQLDAELAMGIGRAAGGVPGEAESLVYAVRALSNQGPVTLDDVLDFCEVEADGVTAAHRKLLTAIDRLSGVDTVGMDRLTTYLGMRPAQVRGLEKRLIDLDLVMSGPTGKGLTSAGVARLRGSCTPEPAVGYRAHA